MNQQNPKSFSSFDEFARSLKIIRAALLVGPIVFLVLVLFLIAGFPKTLEFDIFEIQLLLIIASCAFAYFRMAKTTNPTPELAESIKKSPFEEKDKLIWPIVQSREIIRGALLEGPTFFSIIIVLISDSQVGLIAALVLIALAIAIFPTASRLQAQVDQIKSDVLSS